MLSVSLPRFCFVQNVGVVGADDKRGCTVLITTAGDGEVLPFQMIYGGKTEASLPKTELRHTAQAQGHDFAFSESHWCTNATLKRWVQKILYPAYVERCKKLGLNVGKQECILQYDLYKVRALLNHAILFCMIHPFPASQGACCRGIYYLA